MGMEDDTRSFLVLVANTLALVLLWMMIHIFLGIYLGFAFFEGSPNWKNILYYAFFLISLYFLIALLSRKWKRQSF
ncbi:MAG: hypothetical protein NTZ41_07885 [Sphingobacteriales bacterium]|jgi:hypothetical protein|nr:hypothetical protein [Sphingobacteriales bacterium]